MENYQQYLQRGLNKPPGPSGAISIREMISCSKMSVFPYIKQTGCSLTDVFGFKKEYAEVRFKHNRKEFFEICHDMKLTVGDIVAVEGNPGHDIGIISTSGYLAIRQMIRKNIDPEKHEVKKIFRKAKASDVQRWMMSVENEPSALKRTRRVILDLRLDMKLNDVEFQGDGTKVIFYYTAEDRVDFREIGRAHV